MARARRIPLHRFVVVAASGMVAFVALFQGAFALTDYRPCSIIAPNYVIPANPQAALMQFGISLVGLVVLFNGAKRLRQTYEAGPLAYYVAVLSLIVGEGLLSFIFIRLSSTCAG